MKQTVAIFMMAWLMPAAAFAQEWQVYPYPDAGFAVQFPAPPTVEKSTVKTSAGASLPMTRYTARQERVSYTLDVVDYSSTSAQGTNTIAEAEKALGAAGTVSVSIDARVNRSYGRELSVNGADGSRSAVAIFFVNKRLYTLVGRSGPPNAIQKSGDAVRFQESLQFIGTNGAGGPGGGRFGGRFNPQAVTACVGKSAGDAAQLDGPGGPMPATCTLLARPNAPPP